MSQDMCPVFGNPTVSTMGGCQSYYKLYNMDALITDTQTNEDVISHYNQYIRIIQPGKEPLDERSNI